MADELALSVESGCSPLPASKRPPIRPGVVGGLGVVTAFVIVATVLWALVCGYGAWQYEVLRRHDAGEDRESEEARKKSWSEARYGDGFEGEIPSWPEREREFRAEREVERTAMRWMFVPGVLVTYPLELVAFIFWQMRAHGNLAPLGCVGLRYGSRSSVVWWFVPIAVLWKPLGVVQEIWKGSDPGVAAGDELGWRLRRPSMLATTWWGLLVLAKCLFWFSSFMIFGGLFTIVSPTALWITSLVLAVAASVVQIELVRRVAKRQGALKRKRLAAVAKAEAAGAPVVDVDELMIRVKRRPDEVETVFAGGVAAGTRRRSRYRPSPRRLWNWKRHRRLSSRRRGGC